MLLRSFVIGLYKNSKFDLCYLRILFIEKRQFMNTQVNPNNEKPVQNEQSHNHTEHESKEIKISDSSTNDNDESQLYLSPKAKKLEQKRQQLLKEMESLEQALELEIKEAKQKKIDAINALLDKHGLLDFNVSKWKSKISEIKNLLKT